MQLTVGVTGHRNLHTRDILGIERQVLEALIGLNDSRPFQSRNLITGLAEGADCLVAACALKLGWQVTAVLALPVEEFERDFSGPESLAEFRALLGRCHGVKYASAAVLPRPECYGAVGAHICNEADVLLALWDGDVAAASKVGGTAWVVEHFNRKHPQALEGRRGLIHLQVQRDAFHARKAVVKSSASNMPEHPLAYSHGMTPTPDKALPP